MKNFRNLISFLTILFLFGCSENKPEVEPEARPLKDESELFGTWIMYERGYSPGDIYYTDPVSFDPPQLVKFNADHKFASNIFTEYTYYAIVEYPGTQFKILALFKSKPVDINPLQLEHSYFVSFIGPKLRLVYRSCFEGCHLGFQPTQRDL